MNKEIRKILDFSAKLSKNLAIKSCGAASFFDSHQPRRPEAVLKMAKSEKAR
jgi:cyclic lactone autoinducer peptide